MFTRLGHIEDRCECGLITDLRVPLPCHALSQPPLGVTNALRVQWALCILSESTSSTQRFDRGDVPGFLFAVRQYHRDRHGRIGARGARSPKQVGAELARKIIVGIDYDQYGAPRTSLAYAEFGSSLDLPRPHKLRSLDSDRSEGYVPRLDVMCDPTEDQGNTLNVALTLHDAGPGRQGWPLVPGVAEEPHLPCGVLGRH
jgi:hypothetical protein